MELSDIKMLSWCQVACLRTIVSSIKYLTIGISWIFGKFNFVNLGKNIYSPGYSHDYYLYHVIKFMSLNLLLIYTIFEYVSNSSSSFMLFFISVTLIFVLFF